MTFMFESPLHRDPCYYIVVSSNKGRLPNSPTKLASLTRSRPWRWLIDQYFDTVLQLTLIGEGRLTVFGRTMSRRPHETPVSHDLLCNDCKPSFPGPNAGARLRVYDTESIWPRHQCGLTSVDHCPSVSCLRSPLGSLLPRLE